MQSKNDKTVKNLVYFIVILSPNKVNAEELYKAWESDKVACDYPKPILEKLKKWIKESEEEKALITSRSGGARTNCEKYY